MQIHELNTLSGPFGSGDYLAVDNGTDTGKVSAEQFLSSVEQDVDALESSSLVQGREWAHIASPVVLSDDWVKGTLGSTNGNEYSSEYQIRTPFYVFKGVIKFTGVVKGSGESSARAIFAYFYDASKTFVSRVTMVSGGKNTVYIPSDVYYVRFTYGFASSSGITVDSYGKANLIADWACTFTAEDSLYTENEETGTLGAMVSIAETYLNQAYSADNQIVYDSLHGIYTDPVNDQGKKATVCSQFMKSLLMGTPYEFSRYVQTDNSESWWSYQYDSSTSAVFASTGRGYLPSDQVAKYCDEKGWLVPFDVDHNNIRPGDVVFWSDLSQTTNYLNIMHCAICLYIYWGGCYVVHAARNVARPVDGADAGIEVQRLDWATHTPSYYARLPLIAGKYTNELLFSDSTELTGSYSGSSASIKNFDFNNLPIGIYSLLWEDDGNGVSYAKINPSGVNNNIEPCKQGNKYYIVFYATEPIVRINMRSGQGTTYDFKNFKLYKGYKVNSF